MVFSPFSNATLALTVSSGYSDDGLNPVPLESIINLRAMLNEPKELEFRTLPGLDQPTAKYRGYLVDPLPAGVALPQDVIVTFDQMGEGRFKLVEVLPSPFFDEVSILGKPIELQ